MKSKTYASLLALLLISACATTISVENWPQEIPPRALFVDAFLQQSVGQSNTNDMENHLLWVKRFYRGSVLYPLGWNRMTKSLLETIEDPDEHTNLKRRMYDLGLRICIDWAQSNSIRKIDSASISVWGNSLRTASEQNEQSMFISKVEQDVEAILEGRLDKKLIIRERYYPPEDYDNF